MKTTIHTAYCAMILLVTTGLYTGVDVFAQEAPLLPENDSCITCHLDIDVLPEDFQEYDIHLQEGLSCAGCHGGDPTIEDEDLSMSPQAGFIGIPEKEQLSDLCGRCHSDPAFMHDYQPRIHTDQAEQYAISYHGIMLSEGDTKTAGCVDCHTAHSIMSSTDARSTVYSLNVPATCDRCHGDSAYMQEYNTRTNQLEHYASSVHGRALLEDLDVGAPACNDCHGNHGALPPNVGSLGLVCGTCHLNNMQYLLDSEMAEPWEVEGLHSCVECHGAHEVVQTNDEMMGIGDESVCLQCHDEGEEAYDLAGEIYSHLSALIEAYEGAEMVKQDVIRAGMNDVDIEYKLRDAHQSLIQARTLVHTFAPAAVGEETQKGILAAQEALDLSFAQLDEHRTRRVGFGIATLFITLLTIGLYFKIREMDKNKV